MVPELLTNVPLSGAVLPQVTVPVTELPEPRFKNDPCLRSTSVLPPVPVIVTLSKFKKLLSALISLPVFDEIVVVLTSGYWCRVEFRRLMPMDTDIQSISGSLQDIGLNPDVVLESLLLERGKSIR